MTAVIDPPESYVSRGPRADMRAWRRLGFSWRVIAQMMNARYGVHLSKTAYEQWLVRGREPADPDARMKLRLGLRVCPTCHRKETPRHSYQPKDPDMLRWRNSLTPEQRRIGIRFLLRRFDEHDDPYN